jgi:hypothetical protein
MLFCIYKMSSKKYDFSILIYLTTSLMTFVERPSNILLVLACLQTFLILGESDAPGIYIGN